jgi:hypothetical protein
MHSDAESEEDGQGSEEGEEEEVEPGAAEVGAKGTPCGGKGAAHAAIGFAVTEGMEAELDGVDLDEIEVEAEESGDEEDEDVGGEVLEEGGAADGVLMDVRGPASPKEVQGAEDEGANDEGEEGDAEESPEVEQALVEESAEAGWRFGEVTEEGSGNEEEVDEEVDGDAGVAEGRSGIVCWAFVEVLKGFCDSAEVEAAEEALCGEGVVEDGGELEVEADGEDEGQGEAEGVGPEECREAAEGQGETVEEDVAAFGHSLDPLGFETV